MPRRHHERQVELGKSRHGLCSIGLALFREWGTIILSSVAEFSWPCGVLGPCFGGGYCVYRAHMNLVTLDVRNMDVRRVVSKIEWQTWEHILVNKAVGGQVTLKVKDVPLDEVLTIVGLQTGARWTGLYPIYSTRKAAQTFQKVVRGEIPALGSGWLNLLKTPLWQRGGGSAVSGGVLPLETRGKTPRQPAVWKPVPHCAGVHVDRTPRGHRHHRDPRRAFVAGPKPRERQSPRYEMHQQPEATGNRAHDLHGRSWR